MLQRLSKSYEIFRNVMVFGTDFDFQWINKRAAKNERQCEIQRMNRSRSQYDGEGMRKTWLTKIQTVAHRHTRRTKDARTEVPRCINNQWMKLNYHNSNATCSQQYLSSQKRTTTTKLKNKFRQNNKIHARWIHE